MKKTPPPEAYTEEYFLTDCNGYELFLKGQTPPRLLKALSLLESKPNEHILDVGCGRGELVKECGKVGCKPIGVDYATASTKIARNMGPVIRASATHLPFPDESFDKIAFLEVIEHLDRGDSEKALKEIHRVLRKGGHIVLSTENYHPLVVALLRLYRNLESLLGRQVFASVHVAEKSYLVIKSLLLGNGFKPTILLERFPIPAALYPSKNRFKEAG